MAADFVPLEKLLRRVAAIVHHGGIGTTAQALSAGVPQLPVPMSFDQPDNAYRVERLGVGHAVRRKEYCAGKVVPILERLTTDELVRSRCGEVAAWCEGTEALRIAGDAIEALAEAPAAGDVQWAGRVPR